MYYKCKGWWMFAMSVGIRMLPRNYSWSPILKARQRASRKSIAKNVDIGSAWNKDICPTVVTMGQRCGKLKNHSSINVMKTRKIVALVRMEMYELRFSMEIIFFSIIITYFIIYIYHYILILSIRLYIVIIYIVESWMRGLGGVCCVDYKQAVAEHIRSEAKTKDKELLGDNKRINSSTSSDVKECGLRWWESLINYLVVLIIIRLLRLVYV